MTTRPPAVRIHNEELIVDNFAGGGGASLGIEWALDRSPDIAVNHDAEAIAMHAANHPATRHLCEDVWKVDPLEVCGGRKVALAWFSPDCKHFSKAKGGKPVEKKIRGLAWTVTRWARAVKPRVIILENVEEFEDWGPLGPDNLPDRTREGFTYRRWVAQLRGCGYEVQSRILRACDYGAPTTRKRLFVIARSDGLPIVWPDPTHGPARLPFRTAAECIDFSIPVRSIFGRKKPLAENTERRIARGVKKYVLDNPRPFIIPVAHAGDQRVHSIDGPMPTVTGAHRGEHALVSAGLFHRGNGERPGQDPRIYDVHAPHPTVVAGGVKTGLAAAFLARHYSEREPYVRAGKALDEPLPTVTASDHHSLCATFLAKHFGGHESPGTPLQLPLDTVTAKDHHAVVTSHLSHFYTSNSNGGEGDLRKPMKTITAGGWHAAEVRAFLIKYYGADQNPQLGLPLHTITTKHRFGLVTVTLHGAEYVLFDIGMRMLVPRELFNAQSFPSTYLIDVPFGGGVLTKSAQVAACGNSVPPVLAHVLARAQFAQERMEVAVG